MNPLYDIRKHCLNGEPIAAKAGSVICNAVYPRQWNMR